jgi:hypothetical protein
MRFSIRASYGNNRCHHPHRGHRTLCSRCFRTFRTPMMICNIAWYHAVLMERFAFLLFHNEVPNRHVIYMQACMVAKYTVEPPRVEINRTSDDKVYSSRTWQPGDDQLQQCIRHDISRNLFCYSSLISYSIRGLPFRYTLITLSFFITSTPKPSGVKNRKPSAVLTKVRSVVIPNIPL